MKKLHYILHEKSLLVTIEWTLAVYYKLKRTGYSEFLHSYQLPHVSFSCNLFLRLIKLMEVLEILKTLAILGLIGHVDNWSGGHFLGCSSIQIYLMFSS